MKNILIPVLLLFALSWAPAPAPATEIGQPAPNVALPTAQGSLVALDALRGKVIYVDFWASWCGPCRRSFPWMNEMQQKYGGKGLAIVAVNVDKNRGDAEKFLAQFPAQFPVVFDESGSSPATFGVKGMPTSYLIDASGKVVRVDRGFLDANGWELEDRIRSLLASR